MIPLLLVGRDDALVQKYIDDYIKKYRLRRTQIALYKPDNKELSIQVIRQVKKELITATGPELFVIYAFDTATVEAQNAFLKTLEEKNNVQFIVVVRNEHKLLPTVLSRVKRVMIHSSRSTLPSTNKKVAEFINQIIKDTDSSFLANSLITPLTKIEATEFMGDILSYFRARLRQYDSKAIEILNKTLELKNLLENNNVNPQLTIDNLLIFIRKTYRMK